MATRRVETPSGIAQFDHGAQYVAARDDRFRAALNATGSAVAPWEAARTGLSSRGPAAGAEDPPLVGAPGMSAIPRALAAGLDTQVSTRIMSILRTPRGWSLTREDGASEGPFEAVVIATPAEQAGSLLAAHSKHLAEEASEAATAPCWAGLFAYAAPPGAEIQAIKPVDHPAISWVACDSAKPGRPSALSCWVVHARPDWTVANLERPADEIVSLLRRELEAMIGTGPDLVLAQAHRWRYALVEKPAPSPFGWDADLGLGSCGDWRIGARVEAAWLSGHELAGAMLA